MNRVGGIMVILVLLEGGDYIHFLEDYLLRGEEGSLNMRCLDRNYNLQQYYTWLMCVEMQMEVPTSVKVCQVTLACLWR